MTYLLRAIAALAVLLAAASSALAVTTETKIVYPADAQHIYAFSPDIELRGIAGIGFQTSGSAIVAADLAHGWNNPQSGAISLNLTTMPEKARLCTDIDVSAGIGVNGRFYVNGVRVNHFATDTNSMLAEKVNAVQDQTGVVAEPYSDFVRFTSKTYGSHSQVVLSGMSASINSSYTGADLGVDAAGIVQMLGSNVSDACWDSGDGLVMRDSLGNSIGLSESAGVGPIDGSVAASVDPIDHVEWLNSTTGASGTCTGTNYWSVKNLGLQVGDNLIRVTSHGPGGATATDEILITRVDSTGRSVGPARTHGDGAYVYLEDQVVTAGRNDLYDCFYIQSKDTPVGIRVSGATAQRGETVKLTGVLRTVNGEMELQSNWIESDHLTTGKIGPLAMADPCAGAPTTGLLVKTWGTISMESMRLGTDSGRVLDISWWQPEWNRVLITGISARDVVNGVSRNVLRFRDSEDVVSLP